MSWTRLIRRPVDPEVVEALLLEDADLLVYDEQVGVISTVAGTDALPPGVVDTLGGPTVARKGSWHRPCHICGQPFDGSAVIRPVLASDGTRPYVHEAHLRRDGAAEPESCLHGITPFSACTFCSKKEPAVYPKSRTIRARKAGTCVVCETEFKAKTLIQRVSCATGTGWGHAWHVVGRGK